MYIYLAILGSTSFFSSRLAIVTGSVALLEAVPKAVMYALLMLPRNLDYRKIKRPLIIGLDKGRYTERYIYRKIYIQKDRYT